MTLLDVRGFEKTFHVYHLRREIPVFDGVDFALDPGEFLLVHGPNGVGKSTLLRCLYRSYLPTGGSACYASLGGTIDLARAADVDVAFLRQTEIGHVSQFLHPRPRVSALDLVAEPLWLAGVAPDEARRLAEEWLAAFGLKREIWPAFPTTFSGGEQQKVNLARALILPRRLLLLDEPTASLDFDTRAALVGRLATLKAQGVAILGVFHHPEDVRSLVDRDLHLAAPDVDRPDGHSTELHSNGQRHVHVDR